MVVQTFRVVDFLQKINKTPPFLWNSRLSLRSYGLDIYLFNGQVFPLVSVLWLQMSFSGSCTQSDVPTDVSSYVDKKLFWCCCLAMCACVCATVVWLGLLEMRGNRWAASKNFLLFFNLSDLAYPMIIQYVPGCMCVSVCVCVTVWMYVCV